MVAVSSKGSRRCASRAIASRNVDDKVRHEMSVCMTSLAHSEYLHVCAIGALTHCQKRGVCGKGNRYPKRRVLRGKAGTSQQWLNYNSSEQGVVSGSVDVQCGRLDAGEVR